MTTPPHPVTLAVIERNGQYLLVERQRGDFTDHWGLPGGTIEHSEHIGEAIEREVEEETGLNANLRSYHCTVSEHVELPDRDKHVLIHACNVTVREEQPDTNASWIQRQRINELRTVPSLEPILDTDADYIESAISYSDGAYHLDRFDPR